MFMHPKTYLSEEVKAEWNRINKFIPWAEAPTWSDFALFDGVNWGFSRGPIRDEWVSPFGILEDIKPKLLIYPRPGLTFDGDAQVRLALTGIPQQIALRAALSKDPEREALLALGGLLDFINRKSNFEISGLISDFLSGEVV